MPDSERSFFYSQRLVNIAWLLRLRWVAVAGQLLTVFVTVGALNVQLRLGPMFAVIGFTAVTNLALHAWLALRQARPPRTAGGAKGQGQPWLLVTVMAVDLVSLTVLLYLTGGPDNPFTVFYLVNLALAGVTLPAPWAWSLAVASVLCVASLLVQYQPLPELNRTLAAVRADGPAPTVPPVPPVPPGHLAVPPQGRPRPLRQLGLVAAVSTSALVVTYFITRVRQVLQQRERELRNAQQRRAQSERLESLATLAAGAGHELASPLSTIAVIAKDLTRHLEGTQVSQTVLEDVALIRSELDHCRVILDRMSGHAGEAVGETLRPYRIRKIVEEVLGGLRRRERVDLQWVGDADQYRVVAPLQGLAQAIRGVVQNALDASPESESVRVSIERARIREGKPGRIRSFWSRLRLPPLESALPPPDPEANNQIGSEVIFHVIDRGSGMTPEVLARAGDPFFTTKEPGKGMGLGLFLTRNVIERLGGQLELHSAAGEGARATIRLPAEPPQENR